MSTTAQYDDFPASVVNAAYVDQLMTPGMEKEAAVSMSSYIRGEVLEDSYVANKIMTEQFITAKDLDKSVDLNKMRKIVELEPTAKAAWIAFRGIQESTYLESDAIECPFAMITTPKTIKNVYELKTRDNDIRKIITDNHTKYIQAEQDGAFLRTVDGAVDAHGFKKTYAGGFTKNNVAESLKSLDRQKMPIGCILINTVTARELLKWDKNDIGDNWVSSQYSKGLTITDLMGIKLIITNKCEQVLDDYAYYFGKEDHMGKFFTLTDTTVFFEQKGPWIFFYSYKVLGMVIKDTQALWRGYYPL
jgi:hypothetical protein